MTNYIQVNENVSKNIKMYCLHLCYDMNFMYKQPIKLRKMYQNYTKRNVILRYFIF